MPLAEAGLEAGLEGNAHDVTQVYVLEALGPPGPEGL